ISVLGILWSLTSKLTCRRKPQRRRNVAVGGRVRCQTVSKPRFWSIQALQIVDFVRPHFRKNDFSHSLVPCSAGACCRRRVTAAVYIRDNRRRLAPWGRYTCHTDSLTRTTRERDARDRPPPQGPPYAYIPVVTIWP